MTSPGASHALRAVAYLCRALAIALSACTIALCFASAANLGLLGLVQGLNSVLPTSVSGLLVVATPVGGAFRGDFFLAAVALFVIDWACMRASSSLR